VEEVFAEVVRAAPPVVSFALGCRPDLIARAHDAGSLFLQQVHSRAQAAEAVKAGADAVIAQGGEAGGFGGACSTMILVPQVVDEVAPVPVIAAGGIVDGRGLAAVLALGAQAANVGTRFLASEEAEISDGYKKAVLAATSDQTVRAPFVNELVPQSSEGGYAVAPRVIRNAFVDEWQGNEDLLQANKGKLLDQVRSAMANGTFHELIVVTGEGVGAIDEILPAADIVQQMATQAQEVLRGLAPSYFDLKKDDGQGSAPL
jgi:enoyl-[acyl-carrier protein] reductase II